MPTLAEAITIKVGGNATGFESTMKHVADVASKTVEKIGRKFESAGRTMMKYGAMIETALVGALTAGGKALADFEREYASLTGLFKESKAQLEGYEKAIMSLSYRMGVDAVDTTRAYYQAVSAGFRSIEDATGVVEAATKGAIGGQTDLATSVEAVSRVLNAYEKDGKEAAHVMDLLFQTVNYGVTTFAQLAPNIGRVAGTAATAKISMEELFSAIAVVTKALPTEEAIVAVNQFLTGMIKPTKQASEAAKSLGFDLGATALASKGLSGVLDEMVTKLGITDSKIKKLEEISTTTDYAQGLAQVFGEVSNKIASLFPNIRAMRAAFALARGGGQEFKETLEEMKESTGATEKAFEDQESTIGAAFRKATSHFKLLRIELGKLFKTDIEKFASGIDKLILKFSDWIKKNPEAVKTFIKIGLAIGAGIAALGAFNLAFGKIISLVGSVISALASVVFFLLNPWVLAFSVAIGAALFLFAIFAPNKVRAIWGGFRDFLVGGIEKMRGFIAHLKEMLESSNDVAESQEDIGEKIESAVDPYSEQIDVIADLTAQLNKLKEQEQQIEHEKTQALHKVARGSAEYVEILNKFKAQWTEIIEKINKTEIALESAKEQLAAMPKFTGTIAKHIGVVDETLDSINPKFDTSGMLGLLDKVDGALLKIENKIKGSDVWVSIFLKKLEVWKKAIQLWWEDQGTTAGERFLNAFIAALKDIGKFLVDVASAAWNKLESWGEKMQAKFEAWIKKKITSLFQWLVDKTLELINAINTLLGTDVKWTPELNDLVNQTGKNIGLGPGFQEGGYIDGAYNQRRTIIAHAGEYVINPVSTAMFLPLIQAINAAGRGGVYHDHSENVWNFGDRVSRELVRDVIVPELISAKRAGYGVTGAW